MAYREHFWNHAYRWSLLVLHKDIIEESISNDFHTIPSENLAGRIIVASLDSTGSLKIVKFV